MIFDCIRFPIVFNLAFGVICYVFCFTVILDIGKYFDCIYENCLIIIFRKCMICNLLRPMIQDTEI